MAPRRRWGRRAQPLVPLSRRPQNLDLSCWYCEFKFFVFNEILFSVGSRYSRILKTWFTFGVCFSLLAFVGVTTALVWQSASAVYMYKQGIAVWNLTDDLFLHRLSLVPRSSLSLVDAGYMIFSTIFSVAVHEFGHAIAAASEGVRVEYVAIFFATLFPGALVSFDNEVLDNLPRFTNLRIYCAGIWHNAALCAVCRLALLFLPLILQPLYIHGNNPMVLGVSPRSPLSKQLVYGDVIVSVDGSYVHDPKEWVVKMTSSASKINREFDEPENLGSLFSSGNGKGYCVPVLWLEGSRNISHSADKFGCPDGSKAFVVEPCSNSRYIDNVDPLENAEQRKDVLHCLVAKDIVGLQKCGSGWPALGTAKYRCSCSEGESCLSRVKVPGVAWVEVGYSTPYDTGCYFGQQKREDCGGTFVIEDGTLSIVNSIHLTAYRPRWFFFSNGRFPAVLEKLLAFEIHISAGLVLLNILPVVWLDGNCIMEVAVSYIIWWSPKRRSTFLKLSLLVGTVLSLFAFSRVFLYNLFITQDSASY